MPAAYSQDLRDRVIAACARGMKTGEVAEVFAVSPSWVRRVKQRLHEDGETGPRPPTPRARRAKIDRARLAELVGAHPDATLRELREMLGVQCAESAICKALKTLRLSYKKRRSTRRSRTARTSRGAVSCGAGLSPDAMRGA